MAGTRTDISPHGRIGVLECRSIPFPRRVHLLQPGYLSERATMQHLFCRLGLPPGRAPGGDSPAPPGNSQTPSGDFQTAFGNSRTMFGNSRTPSGDSQTVFGNSRTAFGNSQTAFGNSQTVFGSLKRGRFRPKSAFWPKNRSFRRESGALGTASVSHGRQPPRAHECNRGTTAASRWLHALVERSRCAGRRI